MLRNREARHLALAAIGISIALTAAAAVYSAVAALFVLATAALLIACFLFYTRRRYHEIAELSGYLRRIASGDYALDVRDNAEGELSILRSEIYKVTLKLSEHGAGLQRDKLQLTAAISDISHQLKTPLTSMLMMVDLLRDAQLPELKRAEFTRKIRIQLERIEWLISSLLKLSKIDAGTAYFAQERIQVEALIQKAVEPLLIPMEIKEQRLSVQGDAAAAMIGDFNWTVEALINLVKNAVEHTAAGGEIRIGYEENALFTEIVIADNGQGIAKEDLPYIFQRFYRGKHAGEDSIGIGLSMAHSIIASQNGTIDVDSTAGEGTRFRIKFYKGVI